MEKDHLYKLRHSLAHVLAQAVLEVRQNVQLAFGPPVENGCYYDFQFETPLSSDDFSSIEKKMKRIIQEKQPFESTKRSSTEGLQHLIDINQSFKVEYAKELIQKGETELGFFKNGSFEDMCAGPHLNHTGEIPKDCFKIDSLAGAYWRGDSTRPQLTRIYCLAFENKQLLEEYLKNRKLAQEREHRKLGKELDLFIISDEVGSGLPLWTPNGTVIREALELLAKEKETRGGYSRVCTPHIAKESLYITSGHLPYYADGMFPPMNLEGESKYYLKAMNCPHHHQIYLSKMRSYKDLPIRYAEFGTTYRYEASGSLAGLLRVRSICINDAHIYCTHSQLKEELKATFKMAIDYYSLFRFNNISVRYSTHDPDNKSKFVDNPEAWVETEQIVKEVIDELGVAYTFGFGEAAFYGPKIDFQASTLLGREESIGTTQLDFSQPISFDLKYIDEHGENKRPYIVHRAPLGSQERFVAFLIEHLGGAFPTWMAPIQVKLIPVSNVFDEYVKELESSLKDSLIRVEVDHSDKSFNKKIREAIVNKVPNIIICGGKEVENKTVTLRRYCKDEQITIPRDTFVDSIIKNIQIRKMDNFADIEF